MSMPNIPNTVPEVSVTPTQALNVVLASIGFEELGLAHIINAEGEKIQSFLGTLEGQEVKQDVTVEDLERLDYAVKDTLNTIIKKEMLLLMKLEETLNCMEELNVGCNNTGNTGDSTGGGIIAGEMTIR